MWLKINNSTITNIEKSVIYNRSFGPILRRSCKNLHIKGLIKEGDKFSQTKQILSKIK
jgi:hypothetical protein